MVKIVVNCCRKGILQHFSVFFYAKIPRRSTAFLLSLRRKGNEKVAREFYDFVVCGYNILNNRKLIIVPKIAVFRPKGLFILRNRKISSIYAIFFNKVFAAACRV